MASPKHVLPKFIPTVKIVLPVRHLVGLCALEPELSAQSGD
jgi:hypothetical protein